MLKEFPRKKINGKLQLSPIENWKSSLRQMGCASSQAAATAVQSSTIESDNNCKINDSDDAPKKYPPAEAFEIPLNDPNVDSDSNVDKSESLIKKHPPKRLQRLVEQAAPPQTTISDLEEKLAKAEVRRQQFLQQKVDSAILLGQSNKQDDNNNNENDVVIGSDVNSCNLNDVIIKNEILKRSPGDGDEEAKMNNKEVGISVES